MKKHLKYFFYFYAYLKYRLFITFVLSFSVGLLDGLGLALFIPLLKLVANGSSNNDPEHDRISSFVVEVLHINPNLTNILGLILVFFILKGILKFFEGYVRVLYQQYFMKKIRISNIDLLDSYDFQLFTQSDIGRIQNNFTGEVGRVNSAFRFYFKAFQYGVLVFVYVAMAFVADPSFSLMVALGGVATNLIFKSLYKRTKFFSKKLSIENHNFQGFLIQKVTFFKYLKTTGLNNIYSQRLKRNIFRLEDIQRRMGIIDSLLGALREPLIILVVIVAIYIQVTLLEEDLGLIILSLLLLYRGLTFFMGMQEQWNFFLGASGALDNLKSFSNEMHRGVETKGTRHYQGLKEGIFLRNVTFKYNDQPVLDNINLKIPKNHTVALVGESGSGKSTLVNIISGLLIPNHGECLIGDISTAELETNSFKSKIGYIPQESNVFNDSIFNNVTFWAERTEANYQRFITAIQKAAIFDFVMQLPQKDETLLGNNGINLSGGQKQRLSIARELYKEVELLLMDEATSALDSETEAVIQNNIEILKGKLTIVVIAHRLATIKHADKIVVLNRGEIEAEGSYEELMEKSPRFQMMTQLQNL